MVILEPGDKSYEGCFSALTAREALSCVMTSIVIQVIFFDTEPTIQKLQL